MPDAIDREINLAILLRGQRALTLRCGCGGVERLAGESLALLARWLGGDGISLADLLHKISCPACHGRLTATIGSDGSRTPSSGPRGRRLPVGTLRDALWEKLHFYIHCERSGCGRSTSLDVEALAQSKGLDYTLANVVLACRCQACGARWPDIKATFPPIHTSRPPAIGFHPVEPAPTSLAAARRRGLWLHTLCGCGARHIFAEVQLAEAIGELGGHTPIERLGALACRSCGATGLQVAANWPNRSDNFGAARAHDA